MTTIVQEVYDAFRSVNIAHDSAMRAAAALSERDLDVAEVRRGVGVLQSDMTAVRKDVDELKREAALLRWMVGSLYPLVLAMLALLVHLVTR